MIIFHRNLASPSFPKATRPSAAYAKEVVEQLKEFRIEIKDENETMSKKIREGEIKKIPYMIIIGDKEIKTKSVSVRSLKKGDLGLIKINKLIKKL